MEMLDVIPDAIEIDGRPVFFSVYKHSPIDNEPDHYDAWYLNEDDDLLELQEWTLPNALADLIFWLHKNNYIKF